MKEFSEEALFSFKRFGLYRLQKRARSVNNFIIQRQELTHIIKHFAPLLYLQFVPNDVMFPTKFVTSSLVITMKQNVEDGFRAACMLL